MNKRFANRLNMFGTVNNFLGSDAAKGVYHNVTPVAFTTLATAFTGKVTALTAKCAEQQRSLTGYTIDKKREEAEQEAICFKVSSALVALFLANSDGTRAEKVRRSRSDWESLSDADLLLQAQNLCTSIEEALDVYGETAEGYGITTAQCAAVEKELDDFRAYVQNPTVATAARKAITDSLREEFAAVNGVLGSMDKLIISFNGTEAGRGFVDTYFNARQVIDRGMPAAVLA